MYFMLIAKVLKRLQGTDWFSFHSVSPGWPRQVSKWSLTLTHHLVNKLAWVGRGKSGGRDLKMQQFKHKKNICKGSKPIQHTKAMSLF